MARKIHRDPRTQLCRFPVSETGRLPRSGICGDFRNRSPQTKKWLLLITSRAGVHSSVFFCYDPRVQQAAGSKRGIEHRQGFRDPHGIPNRVNAAQPAEQAGQCKSRLPPLAFPGLLGKRLKKRCSRVLFLNVLIGLTQPFDKLVFEDFKRTSSTL